MNAKEYKIEDGIPLWSPARRDMFPFKDMKEGQSFLVPLSDATPTRIRVAATAFKNRAGNHGYKFAIKIAKPEGGTRVWCLSTPPQEKP